MDARRRPTLEKGPSSPPIRTLKVPCIAGEHPSACESSPAAYLELTGLPSMGQGCPFRLAFPVSEHGPKDQVLWGGGGRRGQIASSVPRGKDARWTRWPP